MKQQLRKQVLLPTVRRDAAPVGGREGGLAQWAGSALDTMFRYPGRLAGIFLFIGLFLLALDGVLSRGRHAGAAASHRPPRISSSFTPQGGGMERAMSQASGERARPV